VNPTTNLPIVLTNEQNITFYLGWDLTMLTTYGENRIYAQNLFSIESSLFLPSELVLLPQQSKNNYSINYLINQ